MTLDENLVLKLVEHGLTEHDIIKLFPERLVNGILLYAPYPLFPKKPEVYSEIIESHKKLTTYKDLLALIVIKNNKEGKTIAPEIRESVRNNRNYCWADFSPDRRFSDEKDTYYVLIQPKGELRTELEEKVFGGITDIEEIIDNTKWMLKQFVKSFYGELIREYGFQQVIDKYELKPKEI